MDYKAFKLLQQQHITTMLKDVTQLFLVAVDKEVLWNTYLDSFPAGTNGIFRERREHDCSACRHFVKAFGNVVALRDGEITTIWDFQTEDPTYQPVIDALAALVKSQNVTDLLVSKTGIFGVDKNHEECEGQILTWEHFYYQLPERLRYRGNETEATVQGRLRDLRNVFKRSLEEISEEALLMVLELIAQKSLYKGEEWEAVLKEFLRLHQTYSQLETSQKDLWTWEQAVQVGPVIGKIRNHSIGVLLTDVTQGVELDEAVRRFEALVAPTNYKRPQAIFTQKMLAEAQKKLEEAGLLPSLPRRFARLEDIHITNVLFANRDVVKRLGGSVFEELSSGIAVNPRNFDRVEEVSIETFLAEVLPQTQALQVLLENRHIPQLVSLIAPQNPEAQSLFKWDNAFSWAYTGNITDSLKERVKAAGGNVEGDLRFSIQWNTEGDNQNDFDAHCVEPRGNEIFFRYKNGHASTGELDVDIQLPGSEVAVENITYADRNRMPEGVYSFFVHNWAHRGGRSGFSAEIEFDGQIYSFDYNKELRQNEKIPVATVSYSRREGFKLQELLPSSSASRKAWGLSTNQFHPVSVCLFSPNYWNAQEGIGHRHYFFLLKDCVNTEAPNGFFNEYLREDLLVHKRVLEALGARMRVEVVEDQLSGVGFSATKRNSLIVKAEGRVSRTLKILF